MSLPGLGVRFGSVRGGATLEGDSVRCTTCCSPAAAGRCGSAARCACRTWRGLSSSLDFRAEQFRAVDVRSFLTLVGTGDLQLRGPVFGATLTGNLLANSGVLYFADLVNKRIIDLEDPSIADLVDTTLIRRENLGAKFQNRFLDSLRIDNLRMEMGSDVLAPLGRGQHPARGPRAGEQGGRRPTSPIGTLNAPRGTYTLKIGPVTRDFTVTRGQVTYTGDLNADARHRGAPHGADASVATRSRSSPTSPAPCTQPKLTLTSTVRPPISETDLVSYLITGYPANEATLIGQGGALQTGLAYFSSALSSELERALIQDIGVPIDLIEIRPGVSTSPAGGGTLTQLAAGMADRQEDLPDVQRRLLPRLQPAQLQEPRRQPRVPLQPRVEAAEHGRADHPVVQQFR